MNKMEARAGIEPAYKDLQSSASPLCHRAFDPSQQIGFLYCDIHIDLAIGLGQDRITIKLKFFAFFVVNHYLFS